METVFLIIGIYLVIGAISGIILGRWNKESPKMVLAYVIFYALLWFPVLIPALWFYLKYVRPSRHRANFYWF